MVELSTHESELEPSSLILYSIVDVFIVFSLVELPSVYPVATGGTYVYTQLPRVRLCSYLVVNVLVFLTSLFLYLL